ncbi:MAG: AAA family ATPase, partial [Kangiellaceae bacterium]|nr:AAA family ATPase [Kangiellaceae bacterium]
MHPKLEQVINSLNQIILGKEQQIRLSLVGLLAKGHLLIEDLPGMGKTTLAHALAKVLGLDFQRIQFTSDLLPADIIGSAIYRRSDETFKFHQGPIFTQVILADEVNRATPKSQSALLEAMEEYQVTSEGVSRKLPEPFFVIATQNPFHQIGTYPLPESQLDRFMIRISLGYPAAEVERLLFKGQETRTQIEELEPVLNTEELMKYQSQVEKVNTSDVLLDYLQALVEASRTSSHWSHGLSPRGGLALLKAAKAWALLDGRDFVLPEDVQAVWISVAGHRLLGQ